METKKITDKKINNENIADAISDIQELCKFDCEGIELSEEQQKANIWFAIKLLTSIPTALTENGLVVRSPIVTKRVISDSLTLLEDRYKKLKGESTRKTLGVIKKGTLGGWVECLIKKNGDALVSGNAC